MQPAPEAATAAHVRQLGLFEDEAIHTDAVVEAA